jgi:cytochrome c-type biogenesis protein CcmH
MARLSPVAFLLVGLAASAAHAVEPDELLKDPALESRARHLSAELRCMVCQNQSIDDSDAPLAKDLRVLVRERLSAGDSDAEVKDYLRARYGDFVLLRPPFDWRTVLPWTAPFAILVVGLISAFLAARRRRRSMFAAPPLSQDEQKALDEILDR